MERKEILVFGSRVYEKDFLAIKVAARLEAEGKRKGFAFRECESLLECIKSRKEGRILILDAVKGLKKVEIIGIKDLEAIGKVNSMHDFDLAMELKLLKKIGYIKDVKIIGVPLGYSLEKAVKETKEALGIINEKG